MQENSAVSNFREYVRIKSVQPNPDYQSCVVWLKKQAIELRAEFYVTECVSGKPIVIITILGKDPSLPSILLNSHTDVVPVFEEHWKFDPFSAHKDEHGNIYGRGTQDMKCVGVQYIEAMKVLKIKGISLLRTVHMSFVPDEEVGGVDGMGKFIETDYFKKLNVGFALDEGYASQDDSFIVFNGERNPWQIWIKCPGSPGHGSQFLPDNAGVKLRKVIDSFMSFRDHEEKRLKEDPNLSLGDVTTINLTMLKGGVQFNVVPAELCVGFDIRLPPCLNQDDFLKKIEWWCKEAGPDVTMDYYIKMVKSPTTCINDGENIWWDTFHAACKSENITLRKEIFPASTDCKYVRSCGIPALGFSPINNTPLLLHDHNEFLNEQIFLRGIKIYEAIISAVANVQ